MLGVQVHGEVAALGTAKRAAAAVDRQLVLLAVEDRACLRDEVLAQQQAELVAVQDMPPQHEWLVRDDHGGGHAPVALDAVPVAETEGLGRDVLLHQVREAQALKRAQVLPRPRTARNGERAGRVEDATTGIGVRLVQRVRAQHVGLVQLLDVRDRLRELVLESGLQLLDVRARLREQGLAGLADERLRVMATGIGDVHRLCTRATRCARALAVTGPVSAASTRLARGVGLALSDALRRRLALALALALGLRAHGRLIAGPQALARVAHRLQGLGGVGQTGRRVLQGVDLLRADAVGVGAVLLDVCCKGLQLAAKRAGEVELLGVERVRQLVVVRVVVVRGGLVVVGRRRLVHVAPGRRLLPLPAAEAALVRRPVATASTDGLADVQLGEESDALALHGLDLEASVAQGAQHSLTTFRGEPGVLEEEPAQDVLQRLHIDAVRGHLGDALVEGRDEVRHPLPLAAVVLSRAEELGERLRLADERVRAEHAVEMREDSLDARRAVLLRALKLLVLELQCGTPRGSGEVLDEPRRDAVLHVQVLAHAPDPDLLLVLLPRGRMAIPTRDMPSAAVTVAVHEDAEGEVGEGCRSAASASRRAAPAKAREDRGNAASLPL